MCPTPKKTQDMDGRVYVSPVRRWRPVLTHLLLHTTPLSENLALTAKLSSVGSRREDTCYLHNAVKQFALLEATLDARIDTYLVPMKANMRVIPMKRKDSWLS